MSTTKECIHCNGTGRSHGRWCLTCDGVGRIPDDNTNWAGPGFSK